MPYTRSSFLWWPSSLHGPTPSPISALCNCHWVTVSRPSLGSTNKVTVNQLEQIPAIPRDTDIAPVQFSVAKIVLLVTIHTHTNIAALGTTAAGTGPVTYVGYDTVNPRWGNEEHTPLPRNIVPYLSTHHVVAWFFGDVATEAFPLSMWVGYPFVCAPVCRSCVSVALLAFP
jgi:hypothetical protein